MRRMHYLCSESDLGLVDQSEQVALNNHRLSHGASRAVRGPTCLELHPRSRSGKPRRALPKSVLDPLEPHISSPTSPPQQESLMAGAILVQTIEHRYHYDQEYISDILRSVKTIAMVRAMTTRPNLVTACSAS